ncbi:MAG: hypothetical protein IM638_16620 [Bacteroidetes bacterium]|nr:hypothetical protein [Bacteroidota bacterium]
MKLLVSILTLALFASCATKPGLSPRIKINVGDTYSVKLNVEMKNRSRFMIINGGTEKQRFSLDTDWKVERIEDDSVYIIAGTIGKVNLHLDNKKEVNLGIPDSLKNNIQRIPLDTVLLKMNGAAYQFKLSRHGEVTETTGADSAIYKAFLLAYGAEVSDSVFRNEFKMLKSFFGSESMNDYLQQLFSAHQSAVVWRDGDEYENEIELNKYVESIDQGITFYCLNEWECKGRNKQNGDVILNAKGRFSERSRNEEKRSQIGVNLKAEGEQQVGVAFDTLSFMPRGAEIIQQYKMSLGVNNIIFNVSIGSVDVNRKIVFQLTHTAR